MPTLAEAIFQKFNDVNSDVNTTEDFVLIAPKISLEDGIPPVLVISSNDVDRAGNPDELTKLLANVVELDVSHNSINNIHEIGVIFQYAPKLKFLNIGYNKFSLVEIQSPVNFPVADTIKTLILIGTEASWEAVWFLLSHTRNCTELHLSRNGYTHVALSCIESSTTESGELGLTKVEKLMFDSNPITSWEEIAKLGAAFPCLNHLSMTECPISTIPKDGGENFQKLKTLWLSNSRISTMGDFENLKYFPVLADLRINGIPFLDKMNDEARRQHFIALLPNITTLNRGRTISESDRVTAERNFIRYYLDHSNPPARYLELKAIHGEVPKLVDVNFKPPTKANLTIMYEDKEFCRIDVHLKKTVKELKDLLESIIGLPASNMDLFYYDPSDDYGGKEVMKFPNKQLYTYHMKNNDEIYVYKKGTVIAAYTRFCK